ncbi:MAG: hypothetical protein ACI9WU_000703 [Myxococcota bacterium]|jgi:hypothetical protein
MLRTLSTRLALSLCLVSGLAGTLSSCKAKPDSKAPSAQPSAAPEPAKPQPVKPQPVKRENPRVALCQTAYANLLRVSRESKAPIQTLNRMAADKAGFERLCLTQPEAVVACLAEGMDRKALHQCSELQPDAVRPKADMKTLCGTALDRAVEVLKKEGMPESVAQQMTDRRDDAIRECTRESEAVVLCLIDANSSAEMHACKLVGQGVDQNPERRAQCEAAFANMNRIIVPGKDMPKAAAKSMAGQQDKFVVGCLGGRPEVAACMIAAQDFATFQKCPGVGSR